MIQYPSLVIPAQAGSHLPTLRLGMEQEMDSRLRGNDDIKAEVHAE